MTIRCYFTGCGPVFFGLVLVAVTILCYWSGLQGDFFFDDQANILQVKDLQIENLSSDTLLQAAKSGIAGPLGRPVTLVSFALNYYVSGFNPFVFKLTNLLIHCLNGMLVFLLAQTFIGMARREWSSHARLMFAAWVSAAWLLHPIQLTSVLYVVQRMNSLAALFLFAALLMHVRVRQSEKIGYRSIAALVVAWGILMPLSAFSKESGVLFFGFVAAYELIIRRGVNGGLDNFGRLYAWFTGLVVMGIAIYMMTPFAQPLLSGYSIRPFSLYERLLTEARVLWMYLGLIVAPHQSGFALYHDDIIISTGILTPRTTLPALVGLAGFAGLAWWARLRVPMLAFGLSWFLVGHSLESSFIPLQIAHEHRNYVPLFGILLLPVAFWPKIMLKPGVGRTLGVTVMLAVLGYMALMTMLRANQFGEEVRRTQIATMYQPNSAAANYDAAVALTNVLTGDKDNIFAYEFIRMHYERAGALDPDFKLHLLGLMQLNCLMGREVERENVNELSKRLQHTLFAPGDRNLLYNLKEMEIAHTLCLKRQDVDSLFNAAISNPGVSRSIRAMLYSWYADYLVLRGRDLGAAKTALNRSLELVPANASNRLKSAQLQILDGQPNEAIRQLKELDRGSLSPAERNLADSLLACLLSDPGRCVVNP